MTKEFCDVCEREVKRNYVSSRLRRNVAHGINTHVRIEIMLGVGNQVGSAINSGAICLDCLRGAVIEAFRREEL